MIFIIIVVIIKLFAYVPPEETEAEWAASAGLARDAPGRDRRAASGATGNVIDRMYVISYNDTDNDMLLSFMLLKHIQ